MLILLALFCLFFAAAPAWFYFRNVGVFRVAPAPESAPAGMAISVLIPARNEAANIEEAIASVLRAAEGPTPVQVEVLALDDASEDDTAERVQRLSAADPRVRLITGEKLPAGWNGKQHACQQLADAATHDTLLWMDADVRLEPGALPRLVAQQALCGADLVSGFPRQITGTPLEKLMLPLIQFVLLSFLSLRAMRSDGRPGFAAGCGQLFFTQRTAYRAAGGHAAIRASRHDGLTLPRAYRTAGLTTDVFDATDLARCRMYAGAGAVWRGLAKNATEGVATPALIGPVSLVLALGQVAWAPLLLVGGLTSVLAGLAGVCVLAPRLDAAVRFRQPLLTWILHPLAVTLFLIIQWEALLRKALGRPVRWRGRV
ncbi:glycosyltransferase family 2 protein [Botrimarina hoheduenensis]|uniref:4,4'-diaponeurosporenoate glycosyltransferase n=1 Tax=Botrimarina hoheduenensis TaxID=2528000 RepID=A0A5C5VYB4_9BACT|nr:glycosyltransferase family 2 protein [Botrimarina hoheduenensis]TWT43147.1 4,4'-diaponeurosporenoate glycosyltransferase [Botrimarina hoheduenensis]